VFSGAAGSGLPDFSWHKRPKREKIYQVTKKLPNGHKVPIPNGRKIFQKAIKYTDIFHTKALQIQYPPYWDFWYENTPSGNPVLCRYVHSPSSGEMINFVS
jgi:hypothetical protein